MVDRERILAKIDELDGYIRDLQTIAPQDFTARPSLVILLSLRKRFLLHFRSCNEDKASEFVYSFASLRLK